MPVFEFRALQLDGEIAEGELEANGRQEAFRQMDAKGLRPIRLVERGGLNHPSKSGPEVGLMSGLRMKVSQSTNRRYRQALLFAFVWCFLWTPLNVFLDKILTLPNNGAVACIELLVPLIVACAILYPSRSQARRPAVQAWVVILTSVVLFCCAFLLWFGILLILIRIGIMAAPFPI